jgi:site-specific DNA-cytosine methylase
MRVLVACEFSGVVRDAFRKRGHDAWSCDLVETEEPGPHIQGDVLNHLEEGWDLMIAHPPCTYLSRAGARWWKIPERAPLADNAAEFVFKLRDASVARIAIENPIGQLNRRWRYPDQVIQPWQFGHPYSKATCLWLKELPLLTPTKVVSDYTPLLPSNVGWNARKGQKSHPGHTRSAKIASTTFQGIADAMAEQWGAHENA